MKSLVAALLVVLAMSSQAAASCSTEVLNQRADMRERLAYVSRRGLDGNHHYSITFVTTAQGVVLPAALLAQYPQDMTIILQHEFERLKVAPEWFEVVLWFKRVRTRVVVPFDAITIFADPSVNFRLDPNPATLGRTCEGA